MKLWFLILFLFYLGESLAQSNYIDNPDPKDALCIQDIQRAKQDIDSGDLKFCVGWALDYPFARMYDELDSLCKNYGLTLRPDTIPAEGGFNRVRGRMTRTCYRDYMNREIVRRFGPNFKGSLINEADSIYIIKHVDDTVYARLCDTEPSYCNEWYSKDDHGIKRDFFSNFVAPEKCGADSSCRSCSFRVFFTVDTIGHASQYRILCPTYKSSLSGSCMDEIERRIITTLEKMNCWKPGILGDRKVISIADILIDIADRSIIN